MKPIFKTISLLLVVVFSSFGCAQDSLNNSGENIPDNITQFQWKLISIETSEKLLKPNLGNYLNEHAYILNFLDESTFQLNTGANLAKGDYSIVANNKIFISNYQEYTEVGASRQEEREFNELQIELFPQVITYQIKDKKLIIEGSGTAFVFQKLLKNE